ncbi:MAG: glycosyltransferase family 2 protein [Coriobacteriia bacterium]|nr:glycosyltransferase family 2 protein [Coriobacteriia bacterium]
MADAPCFSVTVPAYNAADTLGETVASVQAQTFGDWELVIVDDGSTDDTFALAQALADADPRIRVVQQENRGSGGAYNTAVRAARSDLLVMLSADDLILPSHLERFDAFIRDNPDAAIFSSSGYYDYDDGTREVCKLQDVWGDRSTCTMIDLLGACFYNMGAVYRREVFDTVGGFREDIYAEDYHFFLLAFAHGFEHRLLDEPLAIHRRNAVQKSSNAIIVREANIASVQETIDTGLLTPDEVEAAKRAIARLKNNIRMRRILGVFLGPIGATRLINRVRGRHP